MQHYAYACRNALIIKHFICKKIKQQAKHLGMWYLMTNSYFSFYTFHFFNHYSNMVNNLATSFLHANNLNNKNSEYLITKLITCYILTKTKTVCC